MPLREFLDTHGNPWIVWSTIPDRSAGMQSEMQAGWLTFERDGLRKRLAPIPANWEDASVAALRRYCEAAEPFAATRRSRNRSADPRPPC